MWVMVYTGFLLCHSGQQQALLYCGEVTQPYVHTAFYVSVHATFGLSMITWPEQSYTVCNMSNVRNRLAGLHILPRIKISRFCYLGKHLKRRMETSVLKGTHWRMHNVCEKGSRLAGKQWGVLRGHISEWPSFLSGFLYSPSHFVLFTQSVKFQLSVRYWSEASKLLQLNRGSL